MLTQRTSTIGLHSMVYPGGKRPDRKPRPRSVDTTFASPVTPQSSEPCSENPPHLSASGHFLTDSLDAQRRTGDRQHAVLSWAREGQVPTHCVSQNAPRRQDQWLQPYLSQLITGENPLPSARQALPAGSPWWQTGSSNVWGDMAPPLMGS